MLCHAAFDDNSIMTVQFLFLEASDNQQAGTGVRCSQFSEQRHSSAGGEGQQCTLLCGVVPVLHSTTTAAS